LEEEEEEKKKRKERKDLFLKIVYENKKLLFFYFLFLYQIYSPATFIFQGKEKLINIIKQISIFFSIPGSKRIVKQNNKNVAMHALRQQPCGRK